jgi:type IV pilus assembly protein PilM
MALKSVGIDISERSVEAVVLTTYKGATVLSSAVRVEIPAGTVVQGIVEDVPRLAAVLSAALDDLIGPKRRSLNVGMSIPEDAVYSQVFPVPSKLASDLVKQALALEAPDRFPVPMESSVADFALVGTGKDENRYFYSVAHRETVSGYVDALSQAGAQAKFIDTQSMALARALVPKKETEPVMIVDMGRRTTTLIVSELGGVRSSQTVFFGGDMLNEALEHQLKVTMDEAEKIKVKAGFNLDIEDGRLVLILQRPMTKLITEVQRTMNHYVSSTGRTFSRIILAGGTSLIPGIADYMAANLSHTVVAGDVLNGIAFGPKIDGKRFGRRDILYGNAIGLALRGMGIRGEPGVDLMPRIEKKKGLKGFLTSTSSALGSITNAFGSMAPTKKSQRKPAPDKDQGKTPKVAAAHASEADAHKEDVPEVEPAHPAQPVPEPEKTAPPAVPEAKASGSAQTAPDPHVFGAGGKHEFGRGVGDLLGSAATSDNVRAGNENGEGTALPSEGAGKISISSLLNKNVDSDDMSDDPIEEDDGSPLQEDDLDDDVAAPPVVKERRGPVPILLGILLVIAIVAVAGILMFFRKNGGPEGGFLSGIFGGKNTPSETEQIPPEDVAEIPSAVSVGFLAATAEQGDVEKPVILTRAVETDVTLSDSFAPTGEVTKADSVAKGVITVTNKSTRPYTFIATTRFLNPDGILFRMSETTAIPANDTVDVNVYADVAGASGDIGPSTFVIPGLGAELYETVYGTSAAAMTGGSGTVPAVSEEDLVAAKDALMERLEAEAAENFKVMVQEGERILPDLITSTELDFKAPAVGTEGAAFTAELTLRFRVLMIPESDVVPMLQEELTDVLPNGASEVELGSVLYTVEAYDTATETAEIRAEASIR